MSKKFFLMFGQLNSLQPRLYKTLKSVQKYKIQNQQYQIKQYNDKYSAEDAFKIKNIQFKKYQQQSRKINKQQLSELKSNNQNQTNNNIKTTQTGKKIQSNHKSQINIQNHNENDYDNKINKETKPKIRTVQTITAKYIKKTVNELNIQKDKLMSLTPQMPKLLQYYTPTASEYQIFPSQLYTGYYDGSTKRNPGPSGAGYFIKKDLNVYIQAALPLGTKTNNQAQFLAFLYLMIDSYINGIRRINIYGDNKLSICVTRGDMVASSVNIIDYTQACKRMARMFQFIRLEHINRTFNTYADRLANIGVKKKMTQSPDFSGY